MVFLFLDPSDHPIASFCFPHTETPVNTNLLVLVAFSHPLVYWGLRRYLVTLFCCECTWILVLLSRLFCLFNVGIQEYPKTMLPPLFYQNSLIYITLIIRVFLCLFLLFLFFFFLLLPVSYAGKSKKRIRSHKHS